MLAHIIIYASIFLITSKNASLTMILFKNSINVL